MNFVPVQIGYERRRRDVVTIPLQLYAAETTQTIERVCYLGALARIQALELASLCDRFFPVLLRYISKINAYDLLRRTASQMKDKIHKPRS